MNAGFVSYLMQRHGLTREKAERRAEWIAQKHADRAKVNRVKLQSAQLLMPLDADSPTEEPVSKYEQDPNVPF